MGRSSKEATIRRWARPLCSWLRPCLACRSKTEIRQLIEKYLPAQVEEIDWFGDGLREN